MMLLDQINLHTERLPPDMLREVLDFVEFLETRRDRVSSRLDQGNTPGSCLDLAQAHDLVGCLQNAPADLSTNPDYLNIYRKGKRALIPLITPE